MAEAKIDGNYRRSILGVLDNVSQLTEPVRVNPVTKRVLVSAVITSNNTGIGNTIPGGTVGSVLYLGIGSTLAEDNPNFFYDDVQHYLALGHNTPDATLHVVGTARFDLGSDATGDMYYRDASGDMVRLPIGTAGQQLTVQGGLPTWDNFGVFGYDLIQNNGSAVTQRSTINLSTLLTATDNGGSAWTDLTINVTALAGDSTFISTLTSNTTFLTNIANSSVFVDALVANTYFTTELANNANFYTTLANNNNFITTLTANSTFQSSITNVINNLPGLSIDLASQVSGILPLANGGTGSNLSDPGANRLWGWDDTDGSIGFWTIGSGLSYDHATHTLSAAGGSSLEVEINGVSLETGVTKINFTGSVSGSNPTSGEVDIDISGGSGSGDISEQFDDFINSYRISGGGTSTENSTISGNFWSNDDAGTITSETDHPGIASVGLGEPSWFGFTDRSNSTTGTFGPTLIPVADDFRIEALMRSVRTNPADFDTIIGLSDDSGYDVYVRFTHLLSTTFVVVDDGTGNVVSTVPLPTSGSWFTLVFDWNATTTTLTISIDGLTVYSGTPSFAQSTVGFVFGDADGDPGTKIDCDYVRTRYRNISTPGNGDELKVGVGAISDTQWFNIQLPFSMVNNADSEGNVWVASGGNATLRVSFAQVGTSSWVANSSDQVSGILPDFRVSNQDAYKFNSDTKLIVSGQVYVGTTLAPGNRRAAWGLENCADGDFQNAEGTNLLGLGFVCTDAGQWKTHSGTGSGRTENNISVPDGPHTFRIEYDPSHVTPQTRFYVDGVLVDTITTNVPTAINSAVGFLAGNSNDSTYEGLLTVGVPSFAVEI